MKQTRIVFLCLALFLGQSAFAAAAPSQAPAIDPQTAAFLTSLSDPQAPAQGPALPDLGVPLPVQKSGCGDGFCSVWDYDACSLDCYPCTGNLRCRFSTCTMTCTCVC